MVLYHATPYSNLISIVSEGIKLSSDGVVYACEKPEECLRFAYVHGCYDVLVIKFKVDKRKVVETFDHSYEFFKCRCFGSKIPVTLDMIEDYYRYDLTRKG